MKYIIGTRGSKLALRQSEQVKQQLEEAYPQDQYCLQIITTTGDKNQEIALHEMQDKGLFVKEIEQALLDGEIDLAVHSLKDMPSTLPEGLVFTKTLRREDAHDVYIGPYASIEELPLHARIATGSKRREAQLRKLRPDLEIVGIRGNIDTRLRKVEEEKLDGIILAAAGLHRLQLQDKIKQYLSYEKMVPAVGQGALAIELRKENKSLLTKINALCDQHLQDEIDIERTFLKVLNGGCHEPMGAYASIQENSIELWAVYGDEDCENIEVLHWVRPIQECATIAYDAANEVKRIIMEKHHG